MAVKSLGLLVQIAARAWRLVAVPGVSRGVERDTVRKARTSRSVENECRWCRHRSGDRFTEDARAGAQRSCVCLFAQIPRCQRTEDPSHVVLRQPPLGAASSRADDEIARGKITTDRRETGELRVFAADAATTPRRSASKRSRGRLCVAACPREWLRIAATRFAAAIRMVSSIASRSGPSIRVTGNILNQGDDPRRCPTSISCRRHLQSGSGSA